MKLEKAEVFTFLAILRDVLKGKDFTIESDFVLIKKKKQGEDARYSTPYTIIDLDYSVEDVITTLLELSIDEYSETIVDRDNDNPPLLFVFGKKINGKLVYIKLKIRESGRRRIVCVSFHYAKRNMIFPYVGR